VDAFGAFGELSAVDRGVDGSGRGENALGEGGRGGDDVEVDHFVFWLLSTGCWKRKLSGMGMRRTRRRMVDFRAASYTPRRRAEMDFDGLRAKSPLLDLWM
jgi:hypothetical protein